MPSIGIENEVLPMSNIEEPMVLKAAKENPLLV